MNLQLLRQSNLPKSRKGKKKQAPEVPIEDEDAALERTIREVKLLKQADQETASSQHINMDSFIKERRDFVSNHIVSGRGRQADHVTDYSTMTSDYLEVERLIEKTGEARREHSATETQQKELVSLKKELIFFRASLERSIPRFFAEELEQGEIRERLRRIAHVMKGLHAADKLQKFMPNVKFYCKKLFKKFEEAEKEYLVQYNKPFPKENETDEQYVEYAWCRSDTCEYLLEIEEMLEQKTLTLEDSEKLFCYLEQLGKDCLMEGKNLSFLNKLGRNQFSSILEAHYTETWRWVISRYSPQVAKLLLTKVDADACNTALLGACNDHRALGQLEIQARSAFIKVLLADPKSNPNVRRCDIRRNIGITWEAEYTPLLLTCVQADSERAQLILGDPETDPNMLNKGQPALWYLFHETWQDKNPEEIKKIMQLLVQHPKITYSPELLSHIEASPHIGLREAFKKECEMKMQAGAEGRRAKLSEMLKECDPSSQEIERKKREDRVHSFSSAPLTFSYNSDSEKESKDVSVKQKSKKEKIKLGSRSF